MKNKNIIIVKSAGAVIYYIENNVVYYLLLKHIKTDVHWGFPKGKINEKETILECAKREIYEETGLSVYIFEKGFEENIYYQFEKDGVVRDKTVTYFLLKSPEKLTKLSDEHSEFKWCEFDEARDLLSNDNDLYILKRAVDYINMKLSNVLIVSYPKTGRTWLSMILATLFQEKYNLDKKDIISLEKLTYKSNQLPKISLIHEDNPQLKTPIELTISKKKLLEKKKIIFLIRDPRDVIVSWYFHMKNRKGKYEGNISDFLGIPIGGFHTIIEYFNIWNKYSKHKNFLKITYENLSKNPLEEIKKILNFLKVYNIKDEEIINSMQKSSFENMQKMEKENVFNVNRFKTKDVNDTESFKMRKGEVGGYKNYLNKKDIEMLNSYLENLNKDDRKLLNIGEVK
ncbi:MAG: sulfotransferase domain-containing protein [Nanoarchaeota archaeon]